MKVHTLLALACLAAMTFRGFSQEAYFVPDGVRWDGEEVQVIQNPTNRDFTCFLLMPRGSNAFLFNPCLDEGVRTFLVQSNQPISLEAILTNSYPELSIAKEQIFEPGVPFYLGFYTGYNPWLPTNSYPWLIYTDIYTDAVFGWGQFVNNDGVLYLLDSALAYGAGGIYAGTKTLIPVAEPISRITSYTRDALGTNTVTWTNYPMNLYCGVLLSESGDSDWQPAASTLWNMRTTNLTSTAQFYTTEPKLFLRIVCSLKPLPQSP